MDDQVLRDLVRAIQNRRNANSSPPIRASSSSSICEKMAIILRKNPPIGFRGYQPAGHSRGLRPPSASVNNSISCGVTEFFSANPKGIGRTNVPTTGASKVASTRPIYGRGRNLVGVKQSKVLGQGGGQQTSKPASKSASEHRKVEAASSSATIRAAAPTKVPKKRKRPSRKPNVEIVNTTKEGFAAVVQRLTGCTVPQSSVVVRPLPERVEAKEVPINKVLDEGVHSCEQLPARADSSSTSMMSAVLSPSVCDGAPFLILDSFTGVPSSLNDCMGYGRNTPPFLEECYDENLGQLLDGSLHPASSVCDYHIPGPTQRKKGESSSTIASPITESIQEAAVLRSEGNGREGIPREQGCPIYFDHHRMRSHSTFVLDHRHNETSFGTEFDPNDDWRANMRDIALADSFLNDCQWGFQ